jgi:hypothetical protein
MKDEYGFLGITPEHVATAADIQQRLEKRLRSVTITVTAVNNGLWVGYEIITNAKQDFFVGAHMVISDAMWKAGDKENVLKHIARMMVYNLGKAAFLADGGQ